MSGWVWFFVWIFFVCLKKDLFLVFGEVPFSFWYVCLSDSKHLFPHSFTSYLFKSKKFKATLAAEGKAC